MSDGEKYVAAAYFVVFVTVLVYVADHRARSCRGSSGRSAELAELAREPRGPGVAELLVLARAPRLRRGRGRLCGRLRGAGSARARSRRGASGSAGSRRRRCSSARRRRADGFPWGDLGRLAQPLRLARRRRLPDLGLPPALPPARPRRDAARGAAARRSRGSAAAPGVTGRERLLEPRSSSSTSGSCSPAFAGFTLAAGALRALPLAGAAAEAARAPRPARSRRRRSRRSTGSPARTVARRRSRAHARDRGRLGRAVRAAAASTR